MYYLYVVKIDGEVKYVGEGKENRWAHVTSGTSHCYELNRDHFQGRVVEVILSQRTVGSKEEALAREARWIRYFLKKGVPLYNQRCSDGRSHATGVDWAKRENKAAKKALAKELVEGGMKKKEVAKELGVSQNTITNWFKGT